MDTAKTSKYIFPGRRINILDVMVNELTLDQAVDVIESWAHQKRQDQAIHGKRIVTVNPEYVMACRRDPEFMQIVNSASMATADGVGVILAGKLFKTPLPCRITGVQLTHALAQRSAETGLRIFMLGAGPGVADEAAAKLREMYPGVNIVGIFAGNAGPEGDAESVAMIQAAQPDVVLVAYGMIKQDNWAIRNIDKCGAAVTVGVGGTFDFLSGRIKWAPGFIRKIGMEWAYRLYREPWRWRRDINMFKFGMLALMLSFLGLGPGLNNRGNHLLFNDGMVEIYTADFAKPQPE